MGHEAVIPALDGTTGLLPLGRHSATLAEVEAAYVSHPRFASSIRRPKVWGDFLNVLGLTQSIVPVMAVWIAGSFTTSKGEPDDVDAQMWIHGDDSDAHASHPILNIISSGQTRQRLAVDVDAYVGIWRPVVTPRFARLLPLQHDYYYARGHWDDWWQRTRTSPKGALAVPADTVPRRGYLEVIVDGWRS